ncbi:MAG TPA: hypothetical protein VGL75_16535 [Acidothermaceae bacterium]|jgi:hypothetical protein
MTPNDDEALARLRAALHNVADRTPISGGRLNEVSVAAGEKQNRPVVTIVSAAAAVAAIAAVSAVVVGTHSNASRAILPGAPGSGSSTPTPVASPVPQSATPTVNVTPSPSPVGTPTITATPSPGLVLPSTSCVPENYYVTASPAQVAGLTYMLPATPAGYVLYGAWGTISRNQCADSVTWYVEYDPASGAPGDGTNAIQLRVTKVDGDSMQGDFASARPVASTPITVNGSEGYVFMKEDTYAGIGWTTGGAAITLDGPVSNGDVQSLVSVADSLTLVSPSDARIVAPGDCQVPAGSVCGGDSATPTTSPSSGAATATATPSSPPAANEGPPGSAIPVPSPTPTG